MPFGKTIQNNSKKVENLLGVNRATHSEEILALGHYELLRNECTPFQLDMKLAMQILKAGVLYFTLVFGAGFVLGPIRILWAVPRFGTRMAELIEMPIMLFVIIIAARWVIRRFALPRGLTSRLGMGCVALGLLLVSEFALVLWLQGLSIRNYLASRDPVSGTVYFLMLGVFAVVPLSVGRR